MKKLFTLLMCLFVSAGLMTGCTKTSTDTDLENQGGEGDNVVETTPDSSETVGVAPTEALQNAFFDAASAEGATLETVAVALAENAGAPFELATMAIEPGYLAGFDNFEVTEFEDGYMIAPYISTVPFVAYVFDMGAAADEDIQAFMTALSDNSNPRWNICTSAEAQVTIGQGQYVMFAMTPAQYDTGSAE